MATKKITAWIDGAVQEIEVEDIASPEQYPSYDDRLDELEDKPIITDGNFLIGNGTEEMEEITPVEVLEHINGVSVNPVTTAEFEALEEAGQLNANTLYPLTDDELTAEDAMELLAEMNIIQPTTDENGALYVDENNAIYVI